MLRTLTLALLALALLVIVFGAYVRLSDAGLGCPDWPGCYGRLAVPNDNPALHLQNPQWQARPLEVGKAWREMIHRYLASLLGFGIVVLAVLAWRSRRRLTLSPLVYALVPLVIFQGMLGMWTVTLLLKPLVVLAHLWGGLLTLSALWWHWLVLNKSPSTAETPPAATGLKCLSVIALLVLWLQISLGGWTSTNYAALACTDFPTCQGQWWPRTDFGEAFVLWRGLGVNYEYGVLDTPARTAIHMAHRVGAAIAALILVGAAFGAIRNRTRSVKVCGWCILAALIGQLALGLANVLGGLPLGVAVAHNGVAAILLLSTLSLVFFTLRSNTSPS